MAFAALSFIIKSGDCMSETENNTSRLKTSAHELLKVYLIHDGDDRIIAAYEAPVKAVSGDPCVLTRYGYRGANTTQIRFRREYNATWDPNDESWDDNIETLPNPAVDPDI